MYNVRDQVLEPEASPVAKKEARVKLLVVRLTPTERKRIDEVAGKEGLTASSFVRRLVRTTLDRRERRAGGDE